MSNDSTKIIYDPRRQIRVNKIKIDQAEADSFLEMVGRAYKAKKPAKEDLQEIRNFLINRPQLCKAVFGLVEAVQGEIIKNMMGDQALTQIAIEEYVLSVREEMGYNDAPIMEKLIIENIIISWLRVYFCESQLSFRMSGQVSMSVLEFWERRLTVSQRRYLAACESLAKIRKMKIPAVQLNIGEKQINVPGDLNPGTTEVINA